MKSAYKFVVKSDIVGFPHFLFLDGPLQEWEMFEDGCFIILS